MKKPGSGRRKGRGWEVKENKLLSVWRSKGRSDRSRQTSREWGEEEEEGKDYSARNAFEHFSSLPHLLANTDVCAPSPTQLFRHGEANPSSTWTIDRDLPDVVQT